MFTMKNDKNNTHTDEDKVVLNEEPLLEEVNTIEPEIELGDAVSEIDPDVAILSSYHNEKKGDTPIESDTQEQAVTDEDTPIESDTHGQTVTDEDKPVITVDDSVEIIHLGQDNVSDTTSKQETPPPSNNQSNNKGIYILLVILGVLVLIGGVLMLSSMNQGGSPSKVESVLENGLTLNEGMDARDLGEFSNLDIQDGDTVKAVKTEDGQVLTLDVTRNESTGEEDRGSVDTEESSSEDTGDTN